MYLYTVCWLKTPEPSLALDHKQYKSLLRNLQKLISVVSGLFTLLTDSAHSVATTEEKGNVKSVTN